MEIANKNDFVPGVLEKTKSKSEDTNFNNPKTTSKKKENNIK